MFLSLVTNVLDVLFHSEPFPSCILEVSPQDVQEFFCPKDFCLGEELKLMGKHFLLCDCDEFTQKYYEQHHPDIQLKPLPMEKTNQQESSKVNMTCLTLLISCFILLARKKTSNPTILYKCKFTLIWLSCFTLWFYSWQTVLSFRLDIQMPINN